MPEFASLGVGYAAAFGGGLLSFFSPCVLPIIPVVLSVVTGTDITTVTATEGRVGKVARDTSLFVVGFAVMFVLIGLSATIVGQTLIHDKVLLSRVSGVVLIVMAAIVAGSVLLNIGLLGRQARFQPDISRLGPFAAPVAGAAFGVAWTPCATPVLASVLAVAASDGNIAHSVLLLALYSVGLGVPCLAVSLGFSKLAGALAFVRRHVRVVTGVATIGMLGIGILLLMDRLTWLTTHLQSL